ncbi:NUDIX domain-containing protein [Streptomyces sp. NPDC002476]|uniref:NUDIX domain-containing protein n=1 Tax=Streptomyces sp. NPDC002476 TaxID=3364648 RepID=UPI0036CDA928
MPTSAAPALVPYITLREGEEGAPNTLTILRDWPSSQPRLRYWREMPGDRDVRGVLWARCSQNGWDHRGMPTGKPLWKLDQGEPLRVGAARELLEETGVTVDPAHLRMVHVVHHRQSADVERIGFFFEATQWSGEPVNREPEKCLGLEWFSVHELPEDIIEYPGEGLLGYLGGDGNSLKEHGWN